MESTFTKPKKFNYSLVLSFLLVLTTLASYGQGTKSLADEVTYYSPNVPAGLFDAPPYDKETVENPDNAELDDENFARLLASPGIIAGLGSYNGELEITYPSTVSANTTTFIRVDSGDGLFDLLLGGSLGESLGDLLSIVALGEQEFTITARNGATDVYSRSTADGFDIDRARVITDAQGNYYIAFTPDADYDRIFIENGSLSLVGLGSEVNLDVFNAFTYESASICGNPVGTSYDASGLDLDLLSLGGSPADDLHLAIDGDENTYSTLSPGVLSLAGTLEQHFYFDGLGQDSDEVMFTLSSAPGVLDVDLLSNIEIVAYNGSTEVARQDLETLGSELLGIAQLDLLGLLADGNPVTFTMVPGAAFDRFEIEVSTLLNLGTSESLRIHEVIRTPGRPVIDGVDSEQNMLVCAGTDVTLEATVASGDQVYWYDAPTGGSLQHTGASFNIGQVGSKVTYYAAAQRPGCTEESIRVPVTVDINPNPLISLNGAAVYNVAVGESVTLPSATAVNEDDSSSPTSWAALDGAPFSSPNIAGPFTTGGKYTYRVSATGTECTNFVDVVVNVFDPADCPLVYERRYSTSADDFTVSSLLGIQLGSVNNPSQAAGSNMDDYSLLSETVGTSLLGLTGETSQTIRWNTMVPAGTPVTIKLGREYGLTGVSGGIYVQALDGDPIDGDELIGLRQVADANLVSAVNGINEFTYSFIPVDINGVPVAYNGVKISLASLLNAEQNVRVYGAYYHETTATLASCTFGALDVFSGFESIISGLDVATGLTSVTDPDFAVDGDLDTYASLNNYVAANVSSKLDITFSAPSIAGDSVAIKLGSPVEELDLTLLQGFSIQRYLGDQEVGEPLEAGSESILLHTPEDATEQVLSFINDLPFDRIKILSGGILEAIDEIRIYEVQLIPLVKLDGEQHDDIAEIDYIEICPGDIIDTPDSSCDQIKFYTEETGGTEITVEDIAAWAPGTTQTVYLQIVRFGCEDGIDRRPIEIRVLGITEELVDNILINGADVDTFCPVDPVTLEAVLVSGAPGGVGFQWYSDNAGTPELISGENSSTIELSGLTDGSYTYYVEVTASGYCTSDPIPVSFTINRNAVDGDVNLDDLVTQCVGVPVVLTPTSSITNPVFTWYYDAAKTNPITDGDTDGSATLNISASGGLTITGLPDGADKLYYVTVTGDNVCENVTGKEVNVQISNSLPAPTFTNADITLCGPGNDAAFEVTNFAGGFSYAIYDAETGGTEVTADVTVVDNIITIGNVTADVTYWVEVSGSGGCVGVDRSMISITVDRIATADDIDADGGTICEGDNFTLSAGSSTVTNPVFTWYTDAALTTVLADTEVSPAVTTTYYVTVSGDGVCENGAGNAKSVTVTVNRNATADDIDADGSTICEGDSFTLSASSSTVSSPVFTWYADAALTTVVSTNSVSPSTTTTYYVTVSGDGVCENKPGDAKEVTVVVNRNATDADINLDAVITQCVGAPVVLEPTSSIPNPVFTWYYDATKVSPISDGDTDGATTFNISASGELTVTGLADGASEFYYVTVSGDNVCENLAGKEINVQVSNNLPAPTFIDADLELCGPGNDAIFEVTNYAGGLGYSLYDAETGGTQITAGVTIVGNIITISNVTTDVNYWVEVSGSGGCVGVDRASISVTVNRIATSADIDANGGTICEGDSFALSASSSTVTNPVFTWYTDAALTTELSDTDVMPSTTTTYYVTVSGDGVCENIAGDAKEVTVTVNRNATEADIDANGGTICEGDSFTLSASSSTVSSPVFTWYTDAALTTELSDTDVMPSTTTTYYVTVSGDGVCENKAGDAKEVTVTVNRNATVADIDSNGGTICEGDSFGLSASSSTVASPVFTWYTDAALTTELSDTEVTPSTTTTYYVTVSGDGVCENKAGDAKEVTVTVNRNATVADIDSNGGTICEGDSFTLSASSMVSSPVFTWYTDAALTTELSDTDVTPGTTTTYYVTVSGDGVCENKAGDAKEVTVTVNRRATEADLDAEGGLICEGDSFALSASSSTVSNPVFTWYSDAALTTVLSSTDVSPSVSTTYYVTVSGDGVCENKAGDAKEVTVTVNSLPTPTTINPEQSFCKNPAATLADLQVNENNIVWYDSPTGGNALNESTELVQGNTYYAAMMDPVTGCESIGRLAIKVSDCAGLDVEKVADVTAVIVGEMFEYTITVTNNGVATATNVEVTDMVPVALQVLSASNDGTVDGNTVTWQIAEIASGESVVLTISVMALEEHAGVVNMVEVDGDNSLPDEDETDPIPVSPDDVDLSIELAVSDPVVEVGNEFTYQLTITNKSDVPGRNVIVTDNLPEGVEYLGSNASGDIQESYDESTNEITFEIPEVGANQELVIQITVKAIAGGTMINSAQVETPDQEDTFEDDNSASISHDQLSITIPNVFTPNGDGKNDTWEIEGVMELYPDNEVIVVNRWGGEVFKSSNYQNDWDGGSLKEGTYYYKLKIRDSESGKEMQFTGYVTILR